MAWCFSTRAAVATLQTMRICVSSRLWVKSSRVTMRFMWWNPVHRNPFHIHALLSLNKPVINASCITGPLWGSPVDSSHRVPVMWSFGDLLVVSWTSCWTNCRIAGDLRRRCTHLMSLYWKVKKKRCEKSTPYMTTLSATPCWHLIPLCRCCCPRSVNKGAHLILICIVYCIEFFTYMSRNELFFFFFFKLFVVKNIHVFKRTAKCKFRRLHLPVRGTFIPLQWHHMSIISSHYTGTSTICSTACAV